MTIQRANEYFECMDILKAREQLVSNMIISWPHVKQKDRDQLKKEIVKRAAIKSDHVVRGASDLARLLSGK